jgi:TonB-dependent receptor
VRIENRFDQSDRTRAGVAASFDFLPSDNQRFYLRLIGSQYEQENVQAVDRWQLGNGTATALGPRTGTFRNAELRKQTTFVDREETTWMAQLGGVTILDAWRLDYFVSASENELDLPEQLTGRYRARGLIADVVQTDDVANVIGRPGTAANSDPANPANYAFDQLTLIQDFRKDEILTAKLDVTRELDWGGRESSIKFGAKVNRRDKNADRQETSGNPSGTGGIPATTLAAIGLVNYDTRIPNYGFQPEPGAALPLFRSALGALTPAVSNSAAQDFFVGEDVDAAYLMGSVKFGGNVTLFGGARVERTKWSTTGNQVETVDFLTGPDQLTATALAPVENDYTDVLPSVHLRWEPSEQLVVRGALTTALIRPNFDEGAVTRSVSTRQLTAGTNPTFQRSFSGGNPLLDPLRAYQADVSLAWYPNTSTYLYGGLFYKRIDDFFVAGQFVGPDVARLGLPVGNGTLTGGFDVANVVLNGDEATVQGVELAFDIAFKDLPGALSGLFASGNFTWLDSESEVPLLRPGEELRLVDMADRVMNLSLGWENARFTFRVSGNYRGDQLDTLSSNPVLDQVLQEWFSWDINARWNFNDNIQVYADATNLNDRKDETVFRGDATGPFAADEAVNDFGRSYSLGVRVKF